MTEVSVDSRVAARSMARLLLLASAVGLVAGAATFAFLAVDHYGMAFLTEQLPEMLGGLSPTLVSVGVVVAMTLLCTLIVLLYGKRPFDMGMAETEYDHTGRIEYRNIPAGVAFSLASLFSGAAVGPEAPLTDISGGIGTLISERLRLDPAHVRTMAYAGVAGAFGAFFGAAPVGALMAAELINQRAKGLDRVELTAGLASGAVGYVTYLILGGHVIAPVLQFPEFAAPRMIDMGFAVIVGAVGGLLGLAYGGVLLKLRVTMQGVRAKPWLAAVAGGGLLAATAAFAPALMFSGQSQTPTIIQEAATLGVLVLLGLGLGKLVLSAWCQSTAYFGGPLFPVIFAATCFGLALNLAVPLVPQGVAVMGIVAGMTVAATAAPFTVTIFVSLISEPSLAPVIALAAVSAWVVRQAVAPTLPGVYRATRAAEAERDAAHG